MLDTWVQYCTWTGMLVLLTENLIRLGSWESIASVNYTRTGYSIKGHLDLLKVPECPKISVLHHGDNTKLIDLQLCNAFHRWFGHWSN